MSMCDVQLGSGILSFISMLYVVRISFLFASCLFVDERSESGEFMSIAMPTETADTRYQGEGQCVSMCGCAPWALGIYSFV